MTPGRFHGETGAIIGIKAGEEVRAAVEQEVANVESCPHCSDHATARLRWVLVTIDKLREQP